MVAGRTGLSSVGLGAPSVLAARSRGAPDMAVLATTFAVVALAGFARASAVGCSFSLAVGVVDAAAAGLCWLALMVVA